MNIHIINKSMTIINECMFHTMILTLPITPFRTANLRAKLLDFRGFDSSIILILRGEILMSIGNFPESLGQGVK